MDAAYVARWPSTMAGRHNNSGICVALGVLSPFVIAKNNAPFPSAPQFAVQLTAAVLQEGYKKFIAIFLKHNCLEVK